MRAGVLISADAGEHANGVRADAGGDRAPPGRHPSATKSPVEMCPHCGQPMVPASQLRLPKIKARIYDAVKRHPDITTQELRDWVWADAIDGGPLTDTKCLHVHVSQLNDLLAAHGICVRSEGGGYRIRKVTP